MKSKEAELSPLRFTKEGLRQWIQEYLRSDEFVYSWYIDSDDYLHVTIHKKEEN